MKVTCFMGLCPSVCAVLIMKAYVTVPTLNDGTLIVTACHGILQTTLRLAKLLSSLCVRVSSLIWLLLEMDGNDHAGFYILE